MQLPWDNGVKNVRKNHALHVISGLPRSGSTLLSSLLSQNPDIYASISSPLLGAMLAVRNQLNMADYSASSLIKEDEQLDLYRNMIEGVAGSAMPFLTLTGSGLPTWVCCTLCRPTVR